MSKRMILITVVELNPVLNLEGPYTLKYAQAMTEFSKADWNSMVTEEIIPFLEWEWLSALEESGSTAPITGWYPLHLSLWKKDKLLAAAPLYLKNHSEGEFVWDYFWAKASASMGRPWYPKLIGTVPATPAEGYRFLFAPDEDPAALNRILLDTAEAFCRKSGVRGLHFLFADAAWAAWSGSLTERSYDGWKHSRFVWDNTFSDFQEYLSRFNKNQRKNIRKEYHRHEEQGIELTIIEGDDADRRCFDHIFDLYSRTNDKFLPWDARWVNKFFFSLIEQHFRHRTVFSQARRKVLSEKDVPEENKNPLALAMMFRKGNRIWGRYWGACEDIRDLHFAVCYYAPMDYCIREKILYFDPGIGSPHKIRRGFRVDFDHSYHKFFDPVLEMLFKTNIGMVNWHEENAIAELNRELPYKNTMQEVFHNIL